MSRWMRSSSIRLAQEAATAFLASAAFFALGAAGTSLRHELVVVLVLGAVYGYVVFAAAKRFGPLYGVPLAIAAGLAFDSFYIPPTRAFGPAHWQNWLVVAIYLLLGVFVGALASRSLRRAEVSEQARGQLAREQAALRRVATLVATGAGPQDVLSAVAREIGLLTPSSETTVILRYEADRTVTVMALWAEGKGRDAIDASSDELGVDLQPGVRLPLDDVSVPALVLRTGRPARMEDPKKLTGPIAGVNRAAGIRFVAGAPIVVDGRLWGVMLTATSETEPLPVAAESRIAEFTALVGTAVSNAQARAELTASRGRIVAAADETRRRIERDLHDGTQQRLVSLALELRTAEAIAPPEASELKARLGSAAEGLAGAVEDLQEISRGIHPAILSKGGLGPALKGLARRSSLPVELDVGSMERLPQPVETAAYYVVAEALANATKHASASVVEVRLEGRDGTLHVSICDDGVGGADPLQGSGLLGLIDRVEALGGTIAVTSPPGRGTAMAIELPVEID